MKKTDLISLSKKCRFAFGKAFAALAVCCFAGTSFAQTTIYTTDFGTVPAVNPPGWTFTGIGMNIHTNNASSGYTGASGGANLSEGNSGSTFTNTSGQVQNSSPVGTSEAILMVSTTGFTNVALSYGIRKSGTGYDANATYSLAWSTDGSTYTQIAYTEPTIGGWGLVTGAGLSLPLAAANQPSLYIKWTFVRSVSGSNYKIDDVFVLGNIPTVTPAAISFVSNDTTVVENIPSANVFVKLTSTSTASSAITVSVSALSNASGADYTLANTTVTFAANAPINSTAAITINLNDDAIIESAEYIVLKFSNPVNSTIGTISQFIFYIGDNDKVIPQASNSLSLNLLSSFSNGTSGVNSAEIVAHDPASQRLFIANSIGGKLDIVNFVNPSNPVLLVSVPITTYGNINSVAVKNGTIALAIENSANPQDSGKVVFMDINGNYLNQVKVGMMPDMITFNHAGTKVLTANEGEPNNAYTVDPDGSISVINIAGGISALTQNNVSHITFTVYNGQEASLRAQGIRIYGLNASASKDFEPEYITVAPDDSKAWVGLQENNALVEIDLSNNAINYIKALGTKDHSLLNNGFDASNVTRGVNISNFPVKGFYLPDAIASYTVGGNTYIISANEGDARAWGGFSEEGRISSLNLDATKFPNAAELKNNYALGRLNITNKFGDTDNDGDIDTIYTYGSRSFSIWNATTGGLVYDSKDDFEQITATNSFSLLFNVSNSNSTRKDRSDDKGPEPEGVTIGRIGANIYAFIALERIGGVMVYDVTNPAAPVFVTYVNNRTLAANGPDLGAEGIIFIPQSQSPNGQHLVIAANEVSSTLSIWGIAGCSSPLSSLMTVTGNTTNACSNNAPVLSVPSATGITYQWSKDGTPVSGATSNTILANSTGNYSVAITGGTNCVAASVVKYLSVNPSPTLSVTGSTVTCVGSTITHTISGANTYSYNGVSTTSVLTYTPAASGNYTLTGIATNSCSSTLVKAFVVNSLPVVTAYGVPAVICTGDNATLTATGALSYSWSTGSTASAFSLTPASTSTYSVTGTDVNGCKNSMTKTITVNSRPTINAETSQAVICSGESAVLSATGGLTYSWNNGSTASSVQVHPTSTMVYTVTGTNSLNCSAKATITQSVSECTSLSRISAGDVEYNVYPNPAVNEVNVSFAGENKVNLKLVNALGTTVLEVKDYTSDSAINVSYLAKGIYFVQISSGKKQSLKKIIVE